MDKMPEAARNLGGVPEELWRLRVEYAELNRLAMLSHLDIVRFLERVVRRAKLPFAITHGFSPKMRIAFGAALPVGVGGTQEIFDVFLTERISEEDALAALRRVTVPDIPMNDCYYIDRRATAASVAFPLSTYEVVLSEPAEGLVVPEEIVIARGRKKQDKVLKPADYLIGDVEVEDRMIRFTLEAKPTGSLRADALVHQMIDGRDGLRIESFMRIACREAVGE